MSTKKSPVSDKKYPKNGVGEPRINTPKNEILPILREICEKYNASLHTTGNNTIYLSGVTENLTTIIPILILNDITFTTKTWNDPGFSQLNPGRTIIEIQLSSEN